MPDVLIFGDDRSPALRNEVPLPMPDPIAYVETDGSRYVLAGSLDVPRMKGLGTVEVISFEELGLDAVLSGGMTLPDAFRELTLRACRRLDVTEAVVPADFPLALADLLRESGMSIRADGAAFDQRRRSKTPEQLDGIRRAMNAAQLAMAHVRDRLGQEGEHTAEESARRSSSDLRRKRCHPARHARHRGRRIRGRSSRRGHRPDSGGGPDRRRHLSA